MRKLTLFFFLLCAAIGSGRAQSAKSVSILGDSYSTYQGYVEPDTNRLWYIVDKPRNDVHRVSETWWHLFIKENGYKLCKNNSFSGATICNTGYDKADYSQRSFIKRMTNLGCPDIIFIFGATNDSWAGAPIGNYQYGGWTRQDLYSFRPAMAYMLEYMTNRYPNVELHFILNSELSDAINEACRTICAHYGVDLIELHDIDKQGGHPSVKGMRQIADQLNEHLGMTPNVNQGRGPKKSTLNQMMDDASDAINSLF